MFRKKTAPTENILILGLGGVGFYLAKRLIHEEYAITIIEPNAKIVAHADGADRCKVDKRQCHGC